jgi:hypothetical protein
VPGIAPALFKVPLVRRFAFRTVSQLAVNYRGSALSSGEAGKVKGGDRLPWVEYPGMDDNFAALKSLGWQVHVYGDANAKMVEYCAAAALQLQRFSWSLACDQAGLARDAAYLIRPDGYVALADRQGSAENIAQYLKARAIEIAPQETGVS